MLRPGGHLHKLLALTQNPYQQIPIGQVVLSIRMYASIKAAIRLRRSGKESKQSAETTDTQLQPGHGNFAG